MKDLKVRKYKESHILPAFERALIIPRNKALEKVEQKEGKEKRINFPVPFNPRLPNYGAIVKQHWSHMVQKYPDLKSVMPAPPRICYTRPTNLRDIYMCKGKTPAHKRWKDFEEKERV